MTYKPEIGDKICELIAQGKSLLAICKAKGMPTQTTVFRWIAEDKEFREKYARAREAQADALVEEILEIADDGTNDWMASNDPENPGYRLNGEHVQRSKLRVDSRKWFASKVAPKKYGEKLELASDPSAPLVPVVKLTFGER